VIVEMGKAAQGALRLDKKFDIVANRLANAGTTGYKAEDLSFDAMFRAQMRVDLHPGDSVTTGNPLDISIMGDGFFKVQTPQGDRYTRNGTFTLDKDKTLVTQEGYRVLGENGPLSLDGASISITNEGEIAVDGTTVGKLKIVSFDDPKNLKKENNTLFSYSGNAATVEKPPKQLAVKQGALEQANVSVVEEMTRMVEISRQFETFQKLMQTYDEMDTKAVSDVGQVR
jgi:flagellar basal-body rod protein FlgF